MSREVSRKLYAQGTEFQIGKIEMVANTGTYLDSFFHRYADANYLSKLRLEQLAGLAAVGLLPRGVNSIDSSHFSSLRDLAGKAVLV